VQALFDAAANLDGIAAVLGGTATSLMIGKVNDANWIDAWRQVITPVRISETLEIVPAGHAGSLPSAGRVALNMGLAFGTGQHPTTRLCLDWIARHLPPGSEVLDYGAGSGILALASLRCGARRAWATDNDPQALSATSENARLNGFEGSIWIGRPAELPRRSFDVVFANILAGAVIELAPEFAARQGPGSSIVLSGILDEQLPSVRDAYAGDYEGLEHASIDGWSRLAGSRRH
jgi:ribosomal protein L11 methyltransferase